MRRLLWILGTLTVLSAALALVVYAFSGDRGGGRPRPSPRPADFRSCPEVALERPPAGLRLFDAELRNLGDNVMGRSVTYRRGSRELSVNVGYEILDDLEDLDFSFHSAADVKGRRVTVTESTSLPNVRLYAGVWEDQRYEPPCDQFTILATNLSARHVLATVRRLRVTAAG